MKYLNFGIQFRSILKTLIKIEDVGFCKNSERLFGTPFLTIFAKCSILDVLQDSEFASETSNDLRKKLHLSCLTGF